jgi:hypothetical protein
MRAPAARWLLADDPHYRASAAYYGDGGPQALERAQAIDRLGPLLRACTHNAKPKKLRSAKHSIPLHKAFRTSLAKLIYQFLTVKPQRPAQHP